LYISPYTGFVPLTLNFLMQDSWPITFYFRKIVISIYFFHKMLVAYVICIQILAILLLRLGLESYRNRVTLTATQIDPLLRKMTIAIVDIA